MRSTSAAASNGRPERRARTKYFSLYRKRGDNMVAIHVPATPEVGRFGEFGGRYVPETLMPALDELQSAYTEAKADPEFQEQLSYYLTDYVGRPTPVYFAERLSPEIGGARIYFKREDLN